MKPILYIMCGLAFSGKSTLAKAIAKHTGATLISQDAIWFEKLEEEKTTGNKPTYNAVLNISRRKICEALALGRSAVFDNTNAGFNHREEFRQIANECGAKSFVVYLNVSDEELLRRQNANRITKERHDPQEKDIQTVRDHFEAPTQDEKVLEFLPNEDVTNWLRRSLGSSGSFGEN
ncbi:MAG: ATP-binding protein [bacterium]|nr:ATP-binding protein [bacterium]